MPEKKPRVFISYCHVPQEVKDQVLRLANQLCIDDIDCIFDRYEVNPELGWPNWMLDGLDQADYVILVCTEEYEKRFRGRVTGTGAKWEGGIITQVIYEGSRKKSSFIPVVLHKDDDQYIPVFLRGQTWFQPWEKESYIDLYCLLTGQKRIQRPESTGRKTYVPEPVEVLFQRGAKRYAPPSMPGTGAGARGGAALAGGRCKAGISPVAAGAEFPPFGHAAPASLEPTGPPTPGQLQESIDASMGLFGAWRDDTERLVLWNVPHQRNPFFIGRKAELERIHQDFRGTGMAVVAQAHAVCGKGGIGKTQTAVEYAYRYGHEYAAVLWVKAETEEDIVSGFAQLAVLLRLPQAGAADSEIAVQAVLEWLRGNDEWLLVFDNADTPDLLKKYIPNPLRGHILLTSRAPQFDALHMASTVRLEVLPAEEAEKFLLKRAECEPTPGAQAGAAAVAERLGYFPLALEQAGAFVLARRCTFADYLEEYRKKGVSLLGEQGPVVGDYPNTVLTTWAVNFAQVEEKSPAAAELLRVCAFLAPEPIPYRLIIEGAEHIGPAVQAALGEEPGNLAVANLLAPLADFSLVEINRDDHTFTLHRLVQDAVRHGMDDDDEQELARRVVSAVNAYFPVAKVENWSICEAILPHALACYDHIKEFNISTNDAGIHLNKAANYVKIRARYELSENLYKLSLIIFESVFGAIHQITATCISDLADLYQDMGKFAETEQYYQQSLDILEKSLGPEDPSVVTNLNNLGEYYWEMEQFDKAEYLFGKSLAICEGRYGSEDPITAISLNGLGGVYRETNRRAKSKEYYQRALDIREKTIGSKHPDTAVSLHNLARFHQIEGNNAEAEPLFKRALEIDSEVYGPDHPEVAHDQHNLAVLYSSMRRYAEAERLFRLALETRSKFLGPEHPFTGMTCSKLGELMQIVGREVEARQLLERAANILSQNPKFRSKEG